jgi:hypothetical protein
MNEGATPGPGRPKRVIRRPSALRLQRLAQRRAALDSHAAADPVVVACSRDDPYEVLRQARIAAAIEAAALRWRIEFDPPTDSELPKLHGRRLGAVLEIGRMTMAMHWSDVAEPSPELMHRVTEHFLHTVDEAVREVLDTVTADLLVARYRGRIAASGERQ